MPGPGEYRPDPTVGISRAEDLPKTKVCIQSRNYRRAPLPALRTRRLPRSARSGRKESLLLKVLPLPSGIPRKDLFRRVLSTLKPGAFQACFASWLSSLREGR